MGLMAVNVTRDGALSGDDALGRHLATLPPGAPVIVMVHGYKYDPWNGGKSPHTYLFAKNGAGCGRRMSWAVGLGAMDGPRAPLCIGFGWPARGSVWRAWDRSARAALPLAGLLTRIAARGRRAHLIAHSMGARLCLRALALAPAGSVGRVLLLSGAALRSEAQSALASPAGRTAEFVSVCGRENALFDVLTEGIAGLAEPTIGRAGIDDPRWLDLRLDRAHVRAALSALGLPVAPRTARVCHWSSYTRPGVFAVYRALLARHPLPLAALRCPEPWHAFGPLVLSPLPRPRVGDIH